MGRTLALPWFEYTIRELAVEAIVLTTFQHPVLKHYSTDLKEEADPSYCSSGHIFIFKYTFIISNCARHWQNHSFFLLHQESKENLVARWHKSD